MKLYRYIHVLLLLALVWCVPGITHAAVQYTVAPLVIDLNAQARDIITKDITLKNTGTVPVTVYPTVNNISMDKGGTITAFVQRVMSDSTASLAAWTEINRLGITLLAGDTKTITVTFRIHPKPKPGTYHAFIGFGYGRTQDDAVRMVDQGKAPGVVATVNIEDKSITLLRIAEFFVNRFVTSASNHAITYTLDNSGDTPVEPQGQVILYNNRGVEVGSVPVNPDNTSIPPGKSQKFSSTVPIKGLLGKYKAFLSVDYGKQDQASVQDTTFFYIFPLAEVLMFFGALLVVVLMLSLYVHRRYLADELDDAEHIFVHVRDSTTEPKEHDIDLKQQ